MPPFKASRYISLQLIPKIMPPRRTSASLMLQYSPRSSLPPTLPTSSRIPMSFTCLTPGKTHPSISIHPRPSKSVSQIGLSICFTYYTDNRIRSSRTTKMSGREAAREPVRKALFYRPLPVVILEDKFALLMGVFGKVVSPPRTFSFHFRFLKIKPSYLLF